MKTTLRWLGEFVDLPDDPSQVAEAFNRLGHEVEAVESKAVDFSGVVTGRVTGVRPHPNADRLRVADLDLGGRSHRVVCGAWNFDAEAIVPVALPGAVLAGGVEVGSKTIRGVESPGMICSARELGLGDEHEGILVLDEGFSPGEDFATMLTMPDVVFDLNITTNRPDAMGTLGLARDLAAYFEAPLRIPTPELSEHGAPSRAQVTIDDPSGCIRFTARELRNVTVGPSPLWLRLRLEGCGVRAINNVVDATNYAMLELGHPTHAFDMDKLGSRVVVRRPRPGEMLRTLDGVQHDLHPDDLLIADSTRPVGFAGVMGGEDTEVDAGTTTVLVEVAHFDPATILMTAKRHGLRTEASARFERGMNPDGPLAASARVAELIVRHAAAVVAPGFVDEYPNVVPTTTVSLPLAEIPRVLGTDLPPGLPAAYLQRLGFAVGGADPLTVDVPPHRPDVTRAADLLEEIARLHGYDRFPSTVATGRGGGLPQREATLRLISDIMVGAGYNQVLTYSFLGQSHLDDLGLPGDDPRRRGIEVANPLRTEEGVLRTTLLPGLLQTAARNRARRIDDVAVFETGKVFLPSSGALPHQPEHLAWVAAGSRGVAWEGNRTPTDAFDALGMWATLVDALGSAGNVRQAAPPAMHPGRAAELLVDGEVVGYAGEMHPRVAERFGLAGRVAAAEIDLSGLLQTRRPPQVAAVSNYPPVIFDLAFDFPADVAAGDAMATVWKAAGDLLEDLTLFDVFTGAPLTAGHKSLALRLVLRATERTLTDEEVVPVRAAITEAVAREHRGALRGG